MGLPKGKKKVLSDDEKKIIRKIGAKLKEERIKRGHTSYENFAIDMDLPRMVIYRMERGDTDFNFTTLIKVCKALDMSLEELFVGL